MNYSARQLAVELQRLEQKGSFGARRPSVPQRLDASAFAISPGVQAFLDRRRQHADTTRTVCVGTY